MAFNPEKIPAAEYPYPTGTVLSGTGGLSTVLARTDGSPYLEPCPCWTTVRRPHTPEPEPTKETQ